MKKTILTLSLAVLFIGAFAQKRQGAITLDMVKNIQENYKKQHDNKAMINAVSNNKLNNLAVNRATYGKYDDYFKYQVNVSGITNQKSSGRCWLFASLNVFRPKVMEKLNVSSFYFSQNYLFFWDQFEKSNLFLQEIINTGKKPMNDKRVEWLFKSPISDGGVWNNFVNIVEKYGAVPSKVMPETYSGEHTRDMGKILKMKLRENGLELRKMIAKKSSKKKVMARKIEMMQDIYKILVYNLGEPPVNFSWRYKDKKGNVSALKEYTPLSFWKEMLPNVKLDEYVLLMNDASRPYYKLYEIDMDRNTVEGNNWKYVNLPADVVSKICVKSIKNNEAMYYSCDVGKQLDREKGIESLTNYDYESIYGIKFGMNKADRIKTFHSGSSHGMLLCGVDVDENENPTKWKVENSWSASSGHKGYLITTNDWFEEYMFRIVVLKKFINMKVEHVLKQKSTLLPPWDPMFEMDK